MIVFHLFGDFIIRMHGWMAAHITQMADIYLLGYKTIYRY